MNSCPWTLGSVESHIDVKFSDVAKCESFNRYTTIQSLYTVTDHQLQDGLMDKHEFDHTRYIAQQLQDLKLEIHMIEKEDGKPSFNQRV